MIGEIVKIDPPKPAHRFKGLKFERIHFKVWSEVQYRHTPALFDTYYMVCDVVRGYRNYDRWKKVLNAMIGSWVGGLLRQSNGHVSADSFPTLLTTKQTEKIINKGR